MSVGTTTYIAMLLVSGSLCGIATVIRRTLCADYRRFVCDERHVAVSTMGESHVVTPQPSRDERATAARRQNLLASSCTVAAAAAVAPPPASVLCEYSEDVTSQSPSWATARDVARLGLRRPQ